MLTGRKVAVFVCALASVASAGTVTIESVVRSLDSGRDAVPGRAFPFVFRGRSDVQAPVIDNAGNVAFLAFSASQFDFNVGAEFGIYVFRPTIGLDVLVDTTLDGSGAPNFPVPGQPAGTRFLTSLIGAPMLNNSGDVVFFARFHDPSTVTTGEGFYSTTITPGSPIVKIIDSTDAVPGHAGAIFQNFRFGTVNPARQASSVNDLGSVVIWGQFCVDAVCTGGVKNAIFGTDVAGTTPVLLADSTRQFCPVGLPSPLVCAPPSGFAEIRPEIAINNNDVVAFHGTFNSSPSICCAGTYAVPVAGGPIQTVAFRSQPAPGSGFGYADRFDDNEINDAGDYLFQPLLQTGSSLQKFGLYGGSVAGGSHSLVVDTTTGSGIVVPGDVAGAEFATISMAPMNDAGQLGFFAFIRNSATSNNQGIYSTNVGGGPISRVMDATSQPPGLPVGAHVTSFAGRSGAINDSGHMTFLGSGIRPEGTGIVGFRGIYFYDSCADEVLRIADSTTTLADLGGEFSLPGTQRFRLYQSGEARKGHFRSINDNNEVAFVAQFSNFNFGIYIARVDVGAGGSVAITCPADTDVECGGDTGTGANGDATASGCGTITVTHTDASTLGCGVTETITRTWSADNGSSTPVTCDQFITVTDSIDPLVSCPADATGLECPADTSVTALGVATGSDDCGAVTVSSSDVSTSACGDTEAITRTWTSVDDCGNSTSCDQAISTVDTTAPVITVDTTPITVTDADCSGDESVTVPDATVSDDCDAFATVSDDQPATYSAGETTTVTFTASDACGNSTGASIDVTVLYGADIEVHAAMHTVGGGSHPGSTKVPLVGIEVCAYDKSDGSCARVVCGGISHQHYQCIADSCPVSGCDITDAQGVALINLPPGDYVVISVDATKTVLPDPLGVSASNLVCGEVKQKHLQQIVRDDGAKVPGKTSRLTGSELLIIEPEFVIWDGTVQLYPFVFESVGDWSVTTTVAPPEGFVADYNELSETVDNALEAVQFTITEVGSDLVPTQTTFITEHNGLRRTVRSSVGILLTPNYARSRGFNVRDLRSRGLIVDPESRMPVSIKERPARR